MKIGVRQLVDLDVQVAGRAAAGADLALAGEPDPHAVLDARRTLTVSVRRARTRPSPPHSGTGCGMTLPKPWQGGHGREVITWPRNERCTLWISPRPRQMSQVAGWVPGGGAGAGAGRADHRGVDGEVPGHPEGRLGQVEVEPDQRVLPPCRTAAARPARGGAPKNASMMSPNPPKPRRRAAAGGAARRGSPPRSTISRFCGSESTS